MDRAYNLGFLIACVYLLCHLPTSEAGCWERPFCNETFKCDKGWVCLESKCYRYKCQRPEQAYLISKTDVGCDCTDSDFTGDHCECPMLATPPPPTLECESGWRIFESSCYLIADDYKKWEDSKKFCEDNNATLVTIESQSEHDFIVKQLPVSQLAWYWIGGRYDDTSREFKWLSGESIKLDFWRPRMKADETGCMLYSQGYWVKYDCKYLLKRICEKQECESGWRTFESSCYLLADDYKKWEDSKKFCEDNNATLATIESQSEHDFIVKQLPVSQPNLYWIGGRYDDTSREFKWLSGESIKLDFWSPKMKEDATGCMLYTKGYWVKRACKHLLRRICEKQGVQDALLKDYFLGTYDVHISNLSPPHPSRATRVVDHDHVGSLTESFQAQGCGQLVILAGMMTEYFDPGCLSEPCNAALEVLGGNHTREALQSLQRMGAVECQTVKVNIYRSLPRSLALALGYQHNYLLHEKRKPVTFLDKVRLMRDCRPESSTNDDVAEWKDMLVIVFRAKDRRYFQQKYCHHLLMARLPERIWRKIVQAGDVTEKFYRNMMRISEEEMIEECVDMLNREGARAFKSKVSDIIEQGFVRKKKATKKATNKDIEAEDSIVSVVDDTNEAGVEGVVEDSMVPMADAIQIELEAVKAENRELKEKLELLQKENERLMTQNVELASKETQAERGTKRSRDVSISNEDFEKGEDVEAFWRHDSGAEEWLKAKVLTVYADGKKCKVQYSIDEGIAVVNKSWIRKL